jgi:hypothetical protein
MRRGSPTSQPAASAAFCKTVGASTATPAVSTGLFTRAPARRYAAVARGIRDATGDRRSAVTADCCRSRPPSGPRAVWGPAPKSRFSALADHDSESRSHRSRSPAPARCSGRARGGAAGPLAIARVVPNHSVIGQHPRLLELEGISDRGPTRRLPMRVFGRRRPLREARIVLREICALEEGQGPGRAQSRDPSA